MGREGGTAGWVQEHQNRRIKNGSYIITVRAKQSVRKCASCDVTVSVDVFGSTVPNPNPEP